MWQQQFANLPAFCAAPRPPLPARGPFSAATAVAPLKAQVPRPSEANSPACGLPGGDCGPAPTVLLPGCGLPRGERRPGDVGEGCASYPGEGV